MKDINNRLLAEVTRRLVEQFQPEQVILFGSHAWGTPSSDSDVDLMVIVADSALSEYERTLLGHRSLSGLGLPKDIIVRTRAEFEFYRQAKASLEHKVAEQGRVLYERGEVPARQELAAQSPA